MTVAGTDEHAVGVGRHLGELRRDPDRRGEALGEHAVGGDRVVGPQLAVGAGRATFVDHPHQRGSRCRPIGGDRGRTGAERERAATRARRGQGRLTRAGQAVLQRAQRTSAACQVHVATVAAPQRRVTPHALERTGHAHHVVDALRSLPAPAEVVAVEQEHPPVLAVLYEQVGMGGGAKPVGQGQRTARAEVGVILVQRRGVHRGEEVLRRELAVSTDTKSDHGLRKLAGHARAGPGRGRHSVTGREDDSSRPVRDQATAALPDTPADIAAGSLAGPHRGQLRGRRAHADDIAAVLADVAVATERRVHNPVE